MNWKEDEGIQREKFAQTMATHQVCDECVTLQKENRLLHNKLVDEKQKLTNEKKISSELRSSKRLELYACRNECFSMYVLLLSLTKRLYNTVCMQLAVGRYTCLMYFIRD